MAQIAPWQKGVGNMRGLYGVERTLFSVMIALLMLLGLSAIEVL